MRWQYRTILFEFQKDSLLGDKYIDEEEVERTLNEQGKYGWELVNVSLLQEGLLAFLKQAEETAPASLRVKEPPMTESLPVNEKQQGDVPVVTAEELQRQEREHIRQLEEKRQKAMRQREQDLVGKIRIS